MFWIFPRHLNQVDLTPDFVVGSFFTTADVNEAEQSFVKRKSPGEGGHFVRVLEDTQASQLVAESFHVVKDLNHDIVARRVSVRIAVRNVGFNLSVQLMRSIGTAILTGLVEIVVKLWGQGEIKTARL